MSPSKSSDIDFTTFHNIVDGKKRGSDTAHQGVNPTTGEQLWDVPIAGQDDVNDAVEAAEKAFPEWAATPMDKRKELLQKFVELYKNYEKEFTDLLCKETGKPVSRGYHRSAGATRPSPWPFRQPWVT